MQMPTPIDSKPVPWGRAGLARRIYAAFLATAVIPTAMAGLIGVTVSLNTLRSQTLSHLQQEVTARSAGVQLFFDQVAAEMRFLADMSSVGALFDALESQDARRQDELAHAGCGFQGVMFRPWSGRKKLAQSRSRKTST